VITTPDPLRLAPDTFLVRPLATPDGSPTGIHLSSMVILGAEPVLVDTSAALAVDGWSEQVFALVEPTDVRWVFLSHDQHDHTGNLAWVMARCPNATVVTSWLGHQRLVGDVEVPLARQRWINDGDRLDVGDRELVAVRPPVFDAASTRGVFDPRTGVYWSSDAFGTPVTEVVDHVDDLPPDRWADWSDRYSMLLSPWLEVASPAAFGRWVDRVDGLGASVIVGAHGPVLSGPTIDTALSRLRRLPGTELPPSLDQPALEDVLALIV
jgi:flavorubredoxin